MDQAQAQTPPPSSSFTSDRLKRHKKRFKYIGRRDLLELRQKRIGTVVELRKSAKSEQLAKRRNMDQAQAQLEDIPTTNTDIQQESIVVNDTMIHKIVTDILGDNFNAQLAAACCLRKILTSNPPESFSDFLIKNRVVRKIVEFLHLIEHPDLQFESAWILTNILSGNGDETQYIINIGVIPPLIKLLSSPHPQLIHQSLWAIGNIAGDLMNFRDQLIGHGILPPLTVIVRSQSEVKLVRKVAWIISNMCTIKNPAPTMQLVRQFVPILAQLMLVEDLETLVDAAWALSHISDSLNDSLNELTNSGLIPKVTQLLQTNYSDLIFPCIRVIGNIFNGTSAQISTVISTNAVSSLIKLLLSERADIVKEASWALSNLAAGSEEHVHKLLNGRAIPNVLHVLKHGDCQTKSEALWIVANIVASGNPSQISYLCQKGVVECLCGLLSPSENAETLYCAIGCLSNVIIGAEEVNQGNRVRHVIEVCGGVNKIEHLQTHESSQVSNKAIEFIDLHYTGSYDSHEESRPVDKVDHDEFQFLENPLEDETQSLSTWDL